MYEKMVKVDVVTTDGEKFMELNLKESEIPSYRRFFKMLCNKKEREEFFASFEEWAESDEGKRVKERILANRRK